MCNLKFYNKIYSKFIDLQLFVQLLFFLCFSLFIAEAIDFTFEKVNNTDIFQLDFSNYSVQEILFEVVFLAPLIETFLIQFLLIEFILVLSSNLKNKHAYILSILFSGIIFGVLHQYNTAYMIATAILGWCFGSVYIFYKLNKKMMPFFAVLIIHAFHNFITLLKDYTL